MINNNFNNPPNFVANDPAGAADAQAFLYLFGVTEQLSCYLAATRNCAPCPRTVARTSDSPAAGEDTGLGMIEWPGGSGLIEPFADMDGRPDSQVGGFLVREDPNFAGT